ncbi:Crp/Fnr family transcriptional regulator [Sphingomonas sp. BK580]|uniref:Crp/Fnr family transcriptional regulator n=1 Tax=Sphingomonas sp. BK580 TaxID=2586972 RepID=UPI0016092CAD|nr:Crp/Fnr family transcriptional regulator [Sphingomonas sp. BK580]MBB3695614.1 CRP-like cAMP-binding protein [Sphingomonas sp. BK580]
MPSLVQSALARFVKRLELGVELSDAERQAILQLPGLEAHSRQGRELARPGDTVDHAILCAEGIIGRFDIMRSGARQITALYVPGDMSDLHSVVAPSITWGLTPLGPSTIVRIPHTDLKRLATSYPNLALAFWRETTVDASILAKWIANMGRKEARARIAHLLCELGVRMQRAEVGERLNYELPLTQEQIGDATGLTAVHVNRTMNALRRDGIVDVRNRRVLITRWDELVAIAEFDARYLLAGTTKPALPSLATKAIIRVEASH